MFISFAEFEGAAEELKGWGIPLIKVDGTKEKELADQVGVTIPDSWQPLPKNNQKTQVSLGIIYHNWVVRMDP